MRKTISLLSAMLFAIAAGAQTWTLSTENLTLALTKTSTDKVVTQYFGPKLGTFADEGLFPLRSNHDRDTYPTWGLHSSSEKALSVVFPDGNMSVDLAFQSVERSTDNEGEILTLISQDRVYPFVVKQHYKAYKGTDIISTWTELTNLNKKKDVTLLKFASAYIPVRRGDNYLTQFHGSWGHESMMQEERLPNGQTVIADYDGIRNAFQSNASFMVSEEGKPMENAGTVFGGTLMWTGPYKIQFLASSDELSICAGIQNENATYYLQPGETFATPEFAMTISEEGKGGVTRAFHRWARKYGVWGADHVRDVLLNSWEGVYFNVNQPTMDQMMGDIASLGGELFVMDDGWFGDKYPRNDGTSSLGDWMVCTQKLPEGIRGLTDAAKKHGIKFGIWIEPEMANTKSELYEKHPDWILQQASRPQSHGRGNTQVVLDLSNPAVQDYVFSITDKLMTENPDIAYIKWDCNASMMNYGSTYLKPERQSELSVRYHKGLESVLKRIRNKYPNLVIQCCASGGGRVNYGYMRYYNEFWTSDDTDALQRIFIQWGDSHFFPAIAMASHVSASPNHQTRRVLPIKFRFDVAMTGRLGMELQPKDMKPEELEFSKRCIAAYKDIREVVQHGDLYRLISPYAGHPVSSLMYANPEKTHAALFAYRISYLHGDLMPYVKLDGVDENKRYRIRDLSPKDPKRPCFLDGKVISGRILKYTGIKTSQLVGSVEGSVALELVAE